MPTILIDPAIELGTYAVHFIFYDENSVAVQPNSLFWSLTDNDGRVINTRSLTAITSVQASLDVVLSSLDLEISSGWTQAQEERVLTMTGHFNSDLGNILPLHDRVKFTVINLSAL